MPLVLELPRLVTMLLLTCTDTGVDVGNEVFVEFRFRKVGEKAEGVVELKFNDGDENGEEAGEGTAAGKEAFDVDGETAGEPEPGLE